jgi:FkbM family methyltransferase
MTSHSQHGEDNWIVNHLIIPEKGIFVEVGAYDGILSSNTLLFEDMGWDGMLVEADPELAAKCSRNRKAWIQPVAVGTKEGKAPFFINYEDRGLSGLNRPGVEIEVDVVRLDELIDEFFGSQEDQQIDFLSIDTEGTELDAWESIGSNRPTIVMVEWNTLGMPPQDQSIIAQFVKDGYFQVHRTETNLIFLREGSKQR